MAHNLSDHTHHAVHAADEERGAACVANRGVEDVLKVLDHGAAGQLAHGDDESGSHGAAKILAREELCAALHPAGAFIRLLICDLLLDLIHLLVHEILLVGAM